jgi:hypothetical protein
MMTENLLVKVELMAMTTGVALVLIVGSITAIYSQQAFAMNPTSLSLGAFPNKGKVGSAGTLPVSLFGKLTSEGSEVGGATIHISGTGEGKQNTVTTNEFGSYNTHADLGPGTHEIQAYFPGDATHTSSSATRVVTVTS